MILVEIIKSFQLPFIDVNECEPLSCGNGTCVNKINHGYDCSCFTGFERYQNFDKRLIECLDIDECCLPENACPGLNAFCENTIGSFSCGCLDGYERISNKCQDIDECVTGTDNCSALTCVNTDGSFSCCRLLASF